jgi:two-component system, cell cycle sensor histidine kinase and response regulator CckA
MLIDSFCDLSLARHEAGDTTFSDLMNIKQNANRASNLVRQLLAFSRQQTLRPKVLSISDVIAELSNLVRRLIGENITLKIQHGRELSPVKVDQGQLEQVIINLAVNAKDAMPNGGTLTISTRTLKSNDPLFDRFNIIVPDDYVLIELRDTGTGISEKHASKIFEPFFTTKDVGKGTGLGLATVYGIVKQTGGYVYFDSEIGKGTNFMIFLKAYHGKELMDERVEVIEKPLKDLTGQGTILLVEDEDAVRLFTTRALTNKGYKVIQASSGEDGLELYEQNSKDIQLLITDVIMPIMDGPTLVKGAKAINKDLKVIFISGYAEDVVRKDLEDDTCHFLAKPFSLIQLAETVKSVLS